MEIQLQLQVQSVFHLSRLFNMHCAVISALRPGAAEPIGRLVKVR